MKTNKIALIFVVITTICVFLALLGEEMVWTPFSFILLIPIVVLGMFWALLSGHE